MRRLKPDIVLVDLSLRGTNGIELIKLMKAEEPDLPILVISMHNEAVFGLRALKAGALGYVMKAEAINHVAEAIFKVLQGKIYVSPEFAEKLIFKAVQSAELEPDLRGKRYQIANWKSCNSSARAVPRGRLRKHCI